MEPDSGQRSTPHSSRKLVALAAAAGAALLVAGAGSSTSSSVELMAANPAMHIVPNSQSEKLYDIPNFVYERTQTHFPEAEEGWLNMAAAGKIGDDVKPERTLNKLNDVISQARTHGLTENYEARVKAKTLAMTENYNEYDVTKGRVKNKFYDAEKAVQGGSTLKQKAPATLKQAKLAQLASLDSVGAMAAKAHALAAQGQAAVSSGEAAVRSGAASIEKNLEGLKQQVVQCFPRRRLRHGSSWRRWRGAYRPGSERSRASSPPPPLRHPPPPLPLCSSSRSRSPRGSRPAPSFSQMPPVVRQCSSLSLRGSREVSGSP